MNNLTKILFYPFYLLFAYLLLSGLIQALGSQISLNNLTTLAVFVMIAMTIFFERTLPYDSSWNISQGDRKRDFLLTVLIFPLVINLCRWLVSIYPSAAKFYDLTTLPIALQLVVGILVAEFLFYWIHRVSHENRILWKVHVLHHSVKRVYWMNSGTLNPIDMVLNFVGYCIPFAIFNMAPEALEYTLYFTAVTGLLEHANVDFKAGSLNYVFNTAELHRWHHSIKMHESKKNYGKALSVWDLVFGTFYYPKQRKVEQLGVE